MDLFAIDIMVDTFGLRYNLSQIAFPHSTCVYECKSIHLRHSPPSVLISSLNRGFSLLIISLGKCLDACSNLQAELFPHIEDKYLNLVVMNALQCILFLKSTLTLLFSAASYL